MATIQIRDVPDATHDRLKALAADQGLSLNQLLRIELDRLVPAISVRDWIAQLRRHAPAGTPDPGRAARLVREGRDERSERVRDASAR